MGNRSSRNTARARELEDRLVKLEDRLDKNHDNFVSQGEIEQYLDQMRQTRKHGKSKSKSSRHDVDDIDLDHNHDGIISRDELRHHVAKEMARDRAIVARNKEVEHWRSAYNQLESKMKDMITDVTRVKGKGSKGSKGSKGKEDEDEPEQERNGDHQHISYISDRVIEKFIQTEILDTDANNTWIPDAIERRAYSLPIKTVLSVIENLSKSTGFDILGHRITIKIQPIDTATATGE
jgi:hypothetical protein